MRCVAAPAGGLAPPTVEERAALEAVRHLNKRFPRAGLREVPLVRARDLDGHADPTGRSRVWLALEMLQVTGSFKVRGALVSLDARRPHGRVVAAGGGNHALAVAYAGRVLELAATICVPRNTPRERRVQLERYGADVLTAMGDSRKEAEILARRVAVA
ncbi:MAG: pyridoxal-phosphate dependent enzyme, partial [Myxococcales bacterium]|nr:pyridoxal-phosphate dependent enzyme [Myxococcales bacterium]